MDKTGRQLVADKLVKKVIMKKKTGRPKKNIDEALVLKLAGIMCTYSEIAAICDCNETTIRNRFSDIVAKGREIGKSSLRRNMFKLAQTNTTMCIWLSKQYLDMKEPEKGTDDNNEALEKIAKFIKSVREDNAQSKTDKSDK